MAFKLLFCLAAVVACVHAKPGGPAAYSISAPSVDHASVGNTQEHTVKGHYGQSSQSDYSSQVQTAHSQSHVQRSSSSNDGGLAPAYGAAIAAPAIAAHASYAPTASYAHTALAPASYAVAHTAPALASHSLSYAAPAATAYGHGYGHGYGYAAAAAPHGYSYGGYAASAPAVQLSSAHLGYAAPALSHGYLAAAPATTLKYATAAAPAYAHGIIGHHGLGLAAPAAYAAPAYAAHAYAAPAYAAPAYAAHIGAPVLKAAVASPALVHTSVSGHGIHYGY